MAVAPRSEHEGVPHPRGNFTFRDLPTETQDAAHHVMGGIQARAPEWAERLSGEVEALKGKMSGKRGGSPAQATQLDVLQETHSKLLGTPVGGMEASVHRVHETAMMPVEAVRKHRQETGEMLPVLAGEFYPERHRIGQAISTSAFPRDTDAALRLRLAMPEFSARTTPEMEVQGAAGMAAMMRHGEHVKFSVSSRAANMINELKGGSGGVRPMVAGTYNFSELSQAHPQAASLMAQHHAKALGLVTGSAEEKDYTPERLAVMKNRKEILKRGTKIDLPEQLREPMAAMVSGYGDVGFPKGARAMARFHTPAEEFGGHTFHKIPTYTWNIHSMDDTMAAGTHHFLGVLAHGKRWTDAHPEAVEALRAVKDHPAWHDPSSTMDVWSGRVASGLPLHVAHYMGKEKTNPDQIMASMGLPNKPKGARYGSPADVGYLWGEEAHRQAASNISVRVPGVGRVNAPAHVVQSLSWYGVQAEKNVHQVRTGGRTMAPTSMTDPRSLNSLQFPRVFT